MAHSLEIRVPLVDVALLRAVAPMLIGPTPPTKLDLAASPLSPLPASVLNRPKTGFSIPVRQWLLEIAQPSTVAAQPAGRERGLRGWTQYVYQRFAGADTLVRIRRSRSFPQPNTQPSTLPSSIAVPVLRSPSSEALRRVDSTAEGGVRRVDNPQLPLAHLPSSVSPAAVRSSTQPSTLNSQLRAAGGLRILVLATDAFGGHGGIAKFNRDLLSALAAHPDVQEVVALPRLVPAAAGELPAKLRYVTRGVGGKLRYIRAVLKAARSMRSSQPPTPISQLPAPTSSLVICGHINLLPIAWLAQRMMRRPESRKRKAGIRKAETTNAKLESRKQKAENGNLPAPCSLLLIVHGIDAWQPTRSWIVNRLVRSVDAFIAVSEFTQQRFLAWSKLNDVRSFILPNCVDLAEFSPGPKDAQLLERYGLCDRTVLLTVARLSAQERYKGIDEVIAVLPELAKQIPSLTYLIVGDGNDRERLEHKAHSLKLTVHKNKTTNHRTTNHANPSSISHLPSSASPYVLFTGQIPKVKKIKH